MANQGILRGKSHCTLDLLFDWFGISSMITDNFCFYLQNRQIQTSQTGGQQYRVTSPFSIPQLYIHYLRRDASSHESLRLSPSVKVEKLSQSVLFTLFAFWSQWRTRQLSSVIVKPVTYIVFCINLFIFAKDSICLFLSGVIVPIMVISQSVLFTFFCFCAQI